jgi:GAF domain-containing protein
VVGSERYERLSGTIRAVIDARTLDEVVRAIARSFRAAFGLWRVSIVRVLPGRRALIVAVWAVGEPALEPGTEISIDLTERTAEIAEDLAAGRALLLDPAAGGMGLVSDIYRREGIHSWLALPVVDDGEVVAILNLASGARDAFAAGDLPFFRGLAAGISTRVADLVREGARSAHPAGRDRNEEES